MEEKKPQPDLRFECGDKNCKFFIDLADGKMKVTAEPREPLGIDHVDDESRN